MSGDVFFTVESIRTGDAHAFTEFVRLYYHDFVAYATSYTSTQEAAEDMVQDVLLQIWCQRSSLAPKSTLKAYVLGALRHAGLHHVRRVQLETRDKAHRVFSGETLQGILPGTDIATNIADLSGAINRAIARLPDRCREAFLLRRRGGLSYAEIAAEMGISVRGVERQIAIALKKLDSALREWRIQG